MACGQQPAPKQIPVEPKPKNLDEAMTFVLEKWKQADRDKFKNMPEDDAVDDTYLSVGMWIRNNWIHGRRDTMLTAYFNKLGIHAPDDMSAIILTSLHRKLNNRPLRLEQQVRRYRAYWDKISNCEKQVRATAVRNYHRFKVDDEVIVLMTVDTSHNNNTAAIYGCPTIDWTFDKNKDLRFVGHITEKYNINSPDNVFFKIRLDSLNRSGINILGQQAVPGQIVDLPLENLLIK